LAAASVTSLDGLHVDVAIVGAGINGASAAQHLSAAGFSVLVVDQGDFADGATIVDSAIWRPDRISGRLFYGPIASPVP
jgi:flavin-dependent dehydrogenase